MLYNVFPAAQYLFYFIFIQIPVKFCHIKGITDFLLLLNEETFLKNNEIIKMFSSLEPSFI